MSALKNRNPPFSVPTYPASMQLPKALMDGLVGLAMMAPGLTIFFWLVVRSPPSDITRLKASVEAGGARVIEARRVGTQGDAGSRRTFFRTYEITVDNHGVRELRQVGVEATLFGYPRVREYVGLLRRELNS